MSNRTVEFLLKMRDDATAQWNSFRGKVQRDAMGLKSTFAGLGGIIAGVGSVALISKAIQASNEQEQATVRLSTALQNAGIYSKALLSQMEALSSAYQKNTKFADEQVTMVQAMLVAFTGLGGKALEPLLKATLDLAAGMQISGEAAANYVARALAGANSLGRLRMEMEKGATQGQRMATIIATVNKYFKDFAEKEGASAGGRLEKMRNQFGELMETIGDRLKEIILPLLPALNEILNLASGLVNVLVYGLSAGFAQLFAKIAMVGYYISTMLEKVGLSTKEKSTWYSRMWESGTKLAEKYGQQVADVFKSEQKHAGGLSAVGEAADTTAESVDKLIGKFEAMKNLDLTYVSEDQEKRFEDMAKNAERITNWMKQTADVRRALLQEDFEAMLKKPIEPVKEVQVPDVEVKLTKFEDMFAKIQDLATQTGDIMMEAFSYGIDGMVQAMFDGTKSMGQIFSDFARQILIELTKMIVKAAIWKFIMFGLDLLTGGGGFFTQFAGSAAGAPAITRGVGPDASGMASMALTPEKRRAGNVTINVSATDAKSVREWLAKTDVRSQIVSSLRDAWEKEKA